MLTDNEIREIESRQREYAKVFDHSFSPSDLSGVGRLGLIDVPRLIAEVRDLQAECDERRRQSDERNADGHPRPNRVWILHPAAEFVLTKEVDGLPAGSRLVVTAYPLAEVLK